jgi:hypothetical protein
MTFLSRAFSWSFRLCRQCAIPGSDLLMFSAEDRTLEGKDRPINEFP